MHPRDLMELAAALASQSPYLLECNESLHADGMQTYWASSKCRLDRWTRQMKQGADALQIHPREAEQSWRQLAPLIQEVLSGEVLTRVWSGIVLAWDARRCVEEFDPIARSVFVGHLEARRRALSLMVNGQGFQIHEAVALNQLRRRVERWTDLMLGYLSCYHGVEEFAFDAQRMKDFSVSLVHSSGNPNEGAWPLVLASLRSSFPKGLAPECPNASLNREIAAAILSCLPAKMFDGVGVIKSLWLMRFGSLCRDEQGMINDVITATHTGNRLLGRPGSMLDWDPDERQ